MLRRDGRRGMRIIVALVLAFIVGFALNKAVVPLNSAFLDSFALLVAIAVALFLGDATRRPPPRE